VTPDEIAAMLGRGGSILASDAKFKRACTEAATCAATRDGFADKSKHVATATGTAPRLMKLPAMFSRTGGTRGPRDTIQ
jgi:hypothetical protein